MRVAPPVAPPVTLPIALPIALLLTFAGLEVVAQAPLLIDRVEHHDVDNDGVKVHYVTLGEATTGETLLFVHGFPNFWYVWHNQMKAFADEYRVVAMDTRATNRSGKPEGVENYDMPLLLSDINAVIDDLGVDQVTLVAHDWGGIISWQFVMDETYSSRVQRLIMMNLTHPRGFSRTLANATPEQRRATEYARTFQQPGVGAGMQRGAAGRAQRLYADQGERVVQFVQEAYERSDMELMLNFYRANYFKEPYVELTDWPQIDMPVLQFHGLEDSAVDKDGLSNTWDWIDGDYTLVTYPGIGHTVQIQAADRVIETMRWWLTTH
jgi:pimeloyl-ACP methyl ester carboxylesterase